LLIEGSKHVLDTYSPESRASAKRQLEALGVEVVLGQRVMDIRRDEVVLPDRTIRAGTILWAAGVGASPLMRSLGVPLDRQGRVLVEPDLSVPGHPSVF